MVIKWTTDGKKSDDDDYDDDDPICSSGREMVVNTWILLSVSCVISNKCTIWKEGWRMEKNKCFNFFIVAPIISGHMLYFIYNVSLVCCVLMIIGSLSRFHI